MAGCRWIVGSAAERERGLEGKLADKGASSAQVAFTPGVVFGLPLAS
jgi:hypothetical protein